jgi:hypothetical protein
LCLQDRKTRHQQKILVAASNFQHSTKQQLNTCAAHHVHSSSSSSGRGDRHRCSPTLGFALQIICPVDCIKQDSQ